MSIHQTHLALLLFLFYPISSNNSDHVFLKGQVAAGNSTRFVLSTPSPMRVVLQSTSGDADLYFSYKSQDVSYHLDEHDSSSVTCGLDYIDIPALPRPAYMAIYGHPSHATSNWRLLVIMGKNSTYSLGEFELDPEVIYSWNDAQDEAEHSFSYSGLAEFLLDIIHIIIDIFLL